MTWKSLSLFLSLLVTFLLLDASAVCGQGGWQPIKNDPHVQDIGGWVSIKTDELVQDMAKFAVTEHNNQAKSNLKFERLAEARAQSLDLGTNYWFVIVVQDAPFHVETYEAVVWVNRTQSLQLVSFKRPKM
ncbi:cysteine proteinase inhibitor 1-like [Cornus florida]|uniref:cysteine proteinase inhibitor 1-like n=1 Tax=Cornus florida TaxID=4283 RepID=UPI0028988BD0|nr:cysteine proteinase inhibitor 1-like [Cornus florida]